MSAHRGASGRLSQAAALSKRELPELQAHMRATRDRLAELLRAGLPEGSTRVNGPAKEEHRLPNTLSIGLKGVRSSALLAELTDKLAASAGAACHTQCAAISATLQAMRVPPEFGVGTLRLSTGRHTTMEEVERAAKLIVEEARRQWAEKSKVK
jgi:cysteine desulfurase